MQLEARPTPTLEQRHDLRALVDALIAELIDDGATDIVVDTVPPGEGESIRVIVSSDRLPEPRTLAVSA